jgi:sterol desaturase/sphingolipid hydroxylase (fatty acid hydroxylase superfamily)
MFETPIIERFSRVQPAQPFLFWIPVLSYFLYRSISHALGPAVIAGLLVGGTLAWSFTEYVLHRFVFHYVKPTHGVRRMYFILHGVHHDYPQDATRLLMPLGVSIPIGTAFFLIFRAILGTTLVDPAFVGFGIGYLLYDGTHYAVHHMRLTSRVGRYLKRYHMVHHHTGENARWGVSSPLWDWVFGTMGDSRESAAKASEA